VCDLIRSRGVVFKKLSNGKSGTFPEHTRSTWPIKTLIQLTQSKHSAFQEKGHH